MNTSNWMMRSPAWQAARVENRARILSLTVSDGSGNECAYCRKPIGAGAVEHQVETLVITGVRTLCFHRICHHLWEDHTS
jgi:hypothetical protein